MKKPLIKDREETETVASIGKVPHKVGMGGTTEAEPWGDLLGQGRHWTFPLGPQRVHLWLWGCSL